MGSDGKLLYGQLYLPDDDVVIPYTEQMLFDENAEALVGDARTEIQPNDAQSSKVRVYDDAGLLAAFLSEYIVGPTIISFDLPPVLTGIHVTTDITAGNGSNSITGDGASAGTSASLSLSPRSAATASGAVIPDIQPDIQEYYARMLPAVEVLFFIASNPTLNQILARLTTYTTPVAFTFTVTVASPGVFTRNAHNLLNDTRVVLYTTGALPTGLTAETVYYVVNRATNTFQLALTQGGAAINTTGTQSGTHSLRVSVRPWPVFKPQGHSITLSGQSFSLSAEASVQQQVSISGTDVSSTYMEGTGSSYQVGLNTKTVRIPPTIHAALTLTLPTPHAATATVQASADITGGTNWPARSADSTVLTGTATASIYPTTLAATSPSAIPSSGLYLQALQTDNYKYGVNRVRAVVFDFATLA